MEMEDFQVRKLVGSLLIYIFSVPAAAILQSVYMMDQISSFQQNQAILMATGSAIPYFLRWQIM